MAKEKLAPAADVVDALARDIYLRIIAVAADQPGGRTVEYWAEVARTRAQAFYAEPKKEG